MIDTVQRVVSGLGYAIEVLGALMVAIGIGVALFNAATRILRRSPDNVPHQLRRDLGWAMMVGLEFLVAGDVVRTVSAHSLTEVASLALVAVVRTLLVFTIYLELEGRWPWTPAPRAETAGGKHAT